MNKNFQDQEDKNTNVVEDAIILKDVIRKIQDWWRIVLLQKSLIVSFSILIGLSTAIYVKFVSKPSYTASYNLFFEDEGGMNDAMALVSSFGLSLGGSGATSRNTVKEYLHSRDNIAKALLANLDGGLLINRYYDKALKENEVFAAEFAANFGFNQRYTDSVITKITLTLNKLFLRLSPDKETGAIEFSINGNDEDFVYDLASLLILNTEKEFIDQKRENLQERVNAFQIKVDSLELAIDLTLLRLGEYEDQNNSLVSSVEKMKRMRLSIEMELLKVAYGEYIKGLEMSKAELMTLKPPFKYFDEPTYPLDKKKISAAKSGILGFTITGFMILLFFVFREEYRKIMAD